MAIIPGGVSLPDYSINVAQPFTEALKGYELGMAFETERQDRLLKQQQQRQAQEGFVKLNGLLQKITSGTATAAEYREAALLSDPKRAEQIMKVQAGVGEEQAKKDLSKISAPLGAIASGNFEIASQYLAKEADDYEKAGDPPKAQQLRLLADDARDPQKALAVEQTLMSRLAFIPGGDKVIENVNALKEEQRKQALAPETLKEQKAKAERAVKEVQGTLSDDEKVQSSKITPDGTVIIVTNKGNTRVIGSNGTELTGEERVRAVRGSEEFGVDVVERRAGAQQRGRLTQDISLGGQAEATKEAGKIAQREGTKAFEALTKVYGNIANLDDAIAALDKGAQTGVIESQFPNWKASTIELKNIQNRLGLDVIGSVTFGALSEGELSLALETGLPLNMKPPELRNWLTRKKQAQNKLAKYLNDQATHLLTPGNSLQTWLNLQNSQKKPGAAPDRSAGSSGATESVEVGGKSYTRPAGFTDAQWAKYKQDMGIK